MCDHAWIFEARTLSTQPVRRRCGMCGVYRMEPKVPRTGLHGSAPLGVADQGHDRGQARPILWNVKRVLADIDLAKQGHVVVLHARSEARAEGTRLALPQAEAVLVGDLSTLAAMRDVADQANGRGRFDAVIHNVGIGYREPRRVETVDGLSQLWAVNVLAPYVLTALMHKPDRLVYLSSGMHTGGDPSLDDPQWSGRRWNGSQAYADTKLHDVLLAFGVARAPARCAVECAHPGMGADPDGRPGRA
jgi:NAD(P)-dependent dehydrogenase (short-subunit alcohol dehydrogenase family)